MLASINGSDCDAASLRILLADSAESFPSFTACSTASFQLLAIKINLSRPLSAGQFPLLLILILILI